MGKLKVTSLHLNIILSALLSLFIKPVDFLLACASVRPFRPVPMYHRVRPGSLCRPPTAVAIPPLRPLPSLRRKKGDPITWHGTGREGGPPAWHGVCEPFAALLNFSA